MGSLYSFAFVCLYPIGIPLFQNFIIRVNGMTSIVKAKMESAQFSAMLALFLKRALSVEIIRFGHLVGNIDDMEEFNRR